LGKYIIEGVASSLNKILFTICFIGVLFTSGSCMAGNVSVGTSGTPGNIELIRIYIDPYGHPIEDTEMLLAEREVLDRLSEKIYFSEEEIKQKYDVEEISKDGKKFWKCVPKNPKTVTVQKSRTVTKESSSFIEHITEYYNEEIPNPNYLQPEELEKRTVWYEVKKVESETEKTQTKNKNQDIDGMVRRGWFF
jgi:hypothetical protein